jgi:RNA polymerase sigma-70 factor, ECF subfamily
MTKVHGEGGETHLAQDGAAEQGCLSAGDAGAGGNSVEQQLSVLLLEQDWNAAIALAQQSFGAEIYGYLRAVLQDEALAEDALQAFRLALVRGIRTFQRRCEFRVWAYIVAKHEALRVRKSRSTVRSLDSTDLARLRAASSTRDWDKSVNVRKMDCVRSRLTESERELLVLRVDRNMSWAAIASILSTPERPVKANTLAQQLKRIPVNARQIAAELPPECGTPACPCGRWHTHG